MSDYDRLKQEKQRIKTTLAHYSNVRHSSNYKTLEHRAKMIDAQIKDIFRKK